MREEGRENREEAEDKEGLGIGWPRKFRETKFRGISCYFYFVKYEIKITFIYYYYLICFRENVQISPYLAEFRLFGSNYLKENLSQYGGMRVWRPPPPPPELTPPPCRS